MSKSKGNVVTPMALLDEHGSDAVRYWASNAQLGADTTFDVNVMKVGKRLVTKIFNAGKFVFGQAGKPGPVTYGIDLLFLGLLKQLVERVTRAMESYDHEVALAETERFFWVSFTDAFIEMARTRARGSQGEAEQASAITALRLAFSVLLRLFAPFLPFITEEVWSWSAAQETGHSSIHRAPWPSSSDFKDIAIPSDLQSFEVAILALAAINKKRAEHTVSTAREIESVTLAIPSAMHPALTSVLEDVRMAARGRAIDVTIAPHVADGVIEVGSIAFCQ
jgi:valyl-tRNA synthetase